MRFRKKEEKAPQEPVVQGPGPREIGLKGSVEELYEADKAAREDLAVKLAAYKKSGEKYHKRKIFDGEKKYDADQKAYEAALKVPYQIHRALYEGAIEAFLDKRPENLQEILAHPDAFYGSRYEYAQDIVIDTLIRLTSEVPDPETTLLALAKVDDYKVQDTLNDALYALVSRYNDIEERVSVLLRAGARADHGTSKTLAAAFKNQPTAVIDMLLEGGANFDDAIKTMRANPKRYGDSADRIEFLKYTKDTQATILQLKETIEQLTGKPAAEPDAAPAAKTAGPRLKMSRATPK